MMKCQWLILAVLVVNVKAAPYSMSEQMQNIVMRNQQEQLMLNQIAQESMEQWIVQDQYLQQQLMMQQMQLLNKKIQGPMLFNLPPQPLILLMPNTMTKTSTRLENPNDTDHPNLKLGIGDSDTVVINAENEPNIPEFGIIPRIVVLPNGQRFIIGSIISAIPFLPFEVNVPDTIAWMSNGISGIIGGIGQRLPFRPKPTTEKPDLQETMTSSQESMTSESMIQLQPENRWKLIQKLMTRKQSVGMPIVMLPLAQTQIPIQVPIQV